MKDTISQIQRELDARLYPIFCFVNLGQNLGDRAEKFERNFLANIDDFVQGPCQWFTFHDRNLVFFGNPNDILREDSGTFGDDSWSPHFSRLILNRDRQVRRVCQNQISLWYILHRLLLTRLSLLSANSRFDVRITAIVLLFLFDFFTRHFELLLLTEPLDQIVREGQGDRNARHRETNN